MMFRFIDDFVPIEVGGWIGIFKVPWPYLSENRFHFRMKFIDLVPLERGAGFPQRLIRCEHPYTMLLL
jgi:hypothetical protein